MQETPMLFPMAPAEFWKQIRSTIEDVVKENINQSFQLQIFDSFQQVKQARLTAVFEGLFNSLSWKTIPHDQQQQLTNFLLLNPLAFFQTSRLLMEKHDHVHPYLNHDNAGKSYVEQLQKRSIQYKNKSGLYKSYTDLNDWLVHFWKLQKLETLKRSKGMRFLKSFQEPAMFWSSQNAGFLHAPLVAFRKKAHANAFVTEEER